METGPKHCAKCLNDDWLAEFRLRDGRLVRFRHVRPEDEPYITSSIRTASRETLLHRFFSPIRDVSPDLLRKMLAIDRRRETCVVGVIQEGPNVTIPCGARYVKLSVPGHAEIALTVHDRVQHLGLGTTLLKLLAELARQEGIQWFEADVMASNRKMLNLFEKLVTDSIRRNWTGDVYHLLIEVARIPPVVL